MYEVRAIQPCRINLLRLVVKYEMLCATVTLKALVYIDLVGPGFETLLHLFIYLASKANKEFFNPLFANINCRK